MSAQSHPPGEDRQSGDDPEIDETLAMETQAHVTQDGTSDTTAGESTKRMDSASTPDIPGLVIGEVLGEGAMGEVFAGRQEYLNRDVAIKMLGSRCSGASYQTRFKREATLLAGLTHENIVACYDAGISPDGRCFLVMERVLGPSLQTWVKENGPLSPAAALRVLVELARALQHAHRNCTIIHRDVKPANVLLAPMKEEAADGFPFTAKLADLGLARPADAGRVDMALTADGVILGTPSTMAPEQFDDPSGVDRRADIYALGCVLYFSLTGKSAFRGRSLSQIVQAKLVADGPNAIELRPDTPPLLAKLATRMMSAQPENRPQTYQELLEACAALDIATPELSRDSKRWIPAAIGALVILAAAIGYWSRGGGGEASRGDEPGTGSQVAQAPAQEEPAQGKREQTTAEQAGPKQESSEPTNEQQASNSDGEPTIPAEQQIPDSDSALADGLKQDVVPIAAPGADKPSTSEVTPQKVAPTIDPPELTWPKEVLAQAGQVVHLDVETVDADGAAVTIEWSWKHAARKTPELRSTGPLQVEFTIPPLQTADVFVLQGNARFAEGATPILLESLIRVFPVAEPLAGERSLIVDADYGTIPRHWKHFEGGIQFGQLSADEGLFCRSMQKRTTYGTKLPGGAWTFAGTLAVSDGSDVPDRIGLVVTFPHGRRYEWLVTSGESTVVSAQAFTRAPNETSWQVDGEAFDLGAATLGETGIPLTIAWSNGRMTIESESSLVFAADEPIAPDTLGFSVEGGEGELRVPKLSPRE